MLRMKSGRGAYYVVLLVFIIFSAVLLGDGKCNGDEGNLYLAARSLHVGANFGPPYRFFWFLQHVCFAFILDKLGAVLPVVNNAIIHETIASYGIVLYAFLAVIVSWLYLRSCRDVSIAMATVVISSFWFAGYGIGILTGINVEAMLAFYIIVRMFVFTRVSHNIRNKKNQILLALIDTLLFLIKPYTIVFSLIMLPYDKLIRKDFSIKQLLLMTPYFITLLVSLTCVIGFLVFLFGNYFSFLNTVLYPESVLRNPLHYPMYLLTVLFSFTYGLVWTIPVLILLLIYPVNKKELRQKFIAVGVIILLFSTHVLWHGSPGEAGNRYLYPFLLIFIPNIADSIAELLKKHRNAVFLLPILIVFFSPTIDYRHNLIVNKAFLEYKLPKSENTGIYNDELAGEEWNPLFHPAIFAWQVLVDLIEGRDHVDFTVRGEKVELPIQLIVPQTLYSRVVYIRSQARDVHPEYFAILQKLPNSFFNILSIFRYFLLFFWGGVSLVSCCLVRRCFGR